MLARFYDYDRSFPRPFLLNGFFRDALADARPSPEPRYRAPRFDVRVAASAIEIVAEVPGLGEKDVKVTVDQGTLIVEGGRDEKRDDGPAGDCPRPEFRFARRFELPAEVDVDGATATVRDGLLTITLPRAKKPEPRQIPVRTALARGGPAPSAVEETASVGARRARKGRACPWGEARA